MLHADEIWAIIRQEMRGRWFTPSELYPVVERAVQLDEEDMMLGRNGGLRWKRNVRDVLLFRKRSGTGDLHWDPSAHRYRLK